MPKAISAAPQAQAFTVLTMSNGTIARENLPVLAGQIPKAFMQAARRTFKAKISKTKQFFNKPVVSTVGLSEASPIPYLIVSLPLTLQRRSQLSAAKPMSSPTPPSTSSPRPCAIWGCSPI